MQFDVKNIKIGQVLRELGFQEQNIFKPQIFIIFLEQKSLSFTIKSHITQVGGQKVLQLVLDT